MSVSVEASVALPARLRPTPMRVCDWYEWTLRAGGLEVQRTGPHQLEFATPGATAPAIRTLGSVSRGDLEVTDTADGFEVTLRARPSRWTIYANLAALGVFGSTLAISSAGPPWYLLGLFGLGAAAWGWLGARHSLHRFLDVTNEAIAESFSAVPPPAPGAAPGPPIARPDPAAS